jgi:copper homeostasis protein (lipoprotein)
MLKMQILSLSFLTLLTACEPAPKEPPVEPQTAEPASSQTEARSAVADSHNSANALDWAGVYNGVLPCADCEGIQTSLTLHQDQSYQLSTSYLGKEDASIEQQGKFEWNSAGTVIHLLDQTDGPVWYQVAEGQLIQLDMQGQPITGDLADQYKLKKQNGQVTHQLTGVRWTLTELMGQAIATTEPDLTPYLQFNEEGQVSGFAGCNQFTGAYQADGLKLTFKPLATTQKACLNGTTEQQFLATLQGIDNYSLNESGLAFYKARTAALLRFSAAKSQ